VITNSHGIDRMLTMRDLKSIIPYSKNHLYRLIAGGSFPAPIHLGPRRVAWFESEVNAWISGRALAFKTGHADSAKLSQRTAAAAHSNGEGASS